MNQRAWWLALSWAVVVEALLVWRHPPKVPAVLPGMDKVVHCTLFGVQAALLARTMQRNPRRWWIAMISAIAFGAVTEIQQHFIPSRSMELGDFVADSIGAVCGVFAFALWARRRREFVR